MRTDVASCPWLRYRPPITLLCLYIRSSESSIFRFAIISRKISIDCSRLRYFERTQRRRRSGGIAHHDVVVGPSFHSPSMWKGNCSSR